MSTISRKHIQEKNKTYKCITNLLKHILTKGDSMKIRLGYVSISLSLNITSSRTITYTNFQKLNKEKQKEKLDQIINLNFESLKEILKYNYKNDIHFYRLSHNLIPLATHPKVDFDYITPYQEQWKEIGDLIKKYNMRVDVHPDQFCVLNTTSKQILENAFTILEYTYNIYKAMNLNGKIILHVGGAYNNKEESIKRFKQNFNKLKPEIKGLIILENDDKIYNIKDVLEICEDLNIPMCLDYHHYICNNNGEDIKEYLPRILKTWDKEILPPKMHFSSSKNKREKRSHSEFINFLDFIEFVEILKNYNTDTDVMLECKAKDEALFRLSRLLKYKTNYIPIDETTFEL